jgi:hypothetical protein
VAGTFVEEGAIWANTVTREGSNASPYGRKSASMGPEGRKAASVLAAATVRSDV